MLSTKNLSPQQLSLLTATILSVPICIGILIIGQIWWVALISLFVIFIGCYALILFTLQKFIYRKIKLIYKLIYQTKATKREEFYYDNILPKKGIDEVRQDVEEWAEQKKKEIETLQANESFRKEFLQNVSHELRTPIFAIQGYVDTLLNGAMHNKEINEKFLLSASRNVSRLVSLLDNLDEITKLESGEMILLFEPFIIQDLIKEVFDSLELKAAEKNNKCIIKKGCEFPLYVHADREKIRQVLINLSENAIKYGKENGTVEASFYNVDGNNVLIEISDNGDGIAEEHLQRIFERFYRTDGARSRKVGGSGLGLAICKHILEAHRQTIHVRSKVDVGTSFGFTLPSKKS
jgi:two-component system, OmpR family, phosphate regulon sensor histidine kinase PhoR